MDVEKSTRKLVDAVARGWEAPDALRDQMREVLDAVSGDAAPLARSVSQAIQGGEWGLANTLVPALWRHPALEPIVSALEVGCARLAHRAEIRRTPKPLPPKLVDMFLRFQVPPETPSFTDPTQAIDRLWSFRLGADSLGENPELDRIFEETAAPRIDKGHLFVRAAQDIVVDGRALYQIVWDLVQEQLNTTRGGDPVTLDALANAILTAATRADDVSGWLGRHATPEELRHTATSLVKDLFHAADWNRFLAEADSR